MRQIRRHLPPVNRAIHHGGRPKDAHLPSTYGRMAYGRGTIAGLKLGISHSASPNWTTVAGVPSVWTDTQRS